MGDKKSADEVREDVAAAYGAAIGGADGCCGGGSGGGADGCCGGGSGGGEGCGCGEGGRSPRSSPVRMIGYDDADLGAVPRGAADASFGCGNPLAVADVKAGDTVLDLGSGAGLDLVLAARAVGPAGKVIGVDMTAEMIDRARANMAAAGMSNVEVRQGLIEELPVESDSVDWVISNCVINLSPEKDRVFREIVRVLKPGGRLSVSDIVVGNIDEELRSHRQLIAACIGGAIGEDEYLEGLRAAGLDDVSVAERVVYDGAALRALVAGADAADSAGDEPSNGTGVPFAEALAGEVASVRFVARKPRQGSRRG